MHVSIDLGFHKVVNVSPSRPGDSSLMVAKILGLTSLHQTTLLKSEPHKESNTLTGLGRGATPWVLFRTEMDMGHGVFIIFSHFPCVLDVSNGPWTFVQESAAWTVSKSMISGGMKDYNELVVLEWQGEARGRRPATHEGVGTHCCILWQWKDDIGWAPLVAGMEPITSNCDFWPLGPRTSCLWLAEMLGCPFIGL